MNFSLRAFYLLNALLLLTLLIIAIVYDPILSERIPIHWSGSGSVNNTITKNTFLATLVITELTNLGLYVLEKNRKLKALGKTEKTITVFVLSFFTLLFAFFLWQAFK